MVVATPGIYGGPDGRGTGNRDGRWRPLDVRGCGVSDAQRDVSGEARTVRGVVGRGAELHSGRAHGGRVQAHRQGVAQRARGARRAVAGTGGGLISFAHGRSQGHRRALSVSGRAHPDSRPARGRPRYVPSPGGWAVRRRPSAARCAGTATPARAATGRTGRSRRPRTGANGRRRARLCLFNRS